MTLHAYTLENISQGIRMVNDYFKGSEMSVITADKFALTNIDSKVLKEDAELLDCKYWDYKMWHPTVATMYFAQRYHEIAARVAERELGAAKASLYRRKAQHFDLRKQSLATIRAFWKARMHADAIGCTYDVYIRASIRNFRANHKVYASVKASGGKQVMPYPNQIAGKFVIERAIIDWTEEKRARFPTPKSDLIRNNPDLWFRPEMEAWLIEEAKKSEYPAANIREAQKAGLILGEVP